MTETFLDAYQTLTAWCHDCQWFVTGARKVVIEASHAHSMPTGHTVELKGVEQ